MGGFLDVIPVKIVNKLLKPVDSAKSISNYTCNGYEDKKMRLDRLR